MTPDIDPQVYQQLMDDQAQQPQTAQQPEPQMQQHVQQQPPQVLQPQPEPVPEPAQDDGAIVDEAKKALGLDELEQKIRQQEEMLAKIEAEKARALMEKKYPNVPFDAVEQEIEKVAQVNPALAEAMKTNADAMELAYKAALASIRPQEEPDTITEGEGGGGNDSDLDDAVKKGEADDFMLGEWILKQEG